MRHDEGRHPRSRRRGGPGGGVLDGDRCARLHAQPPRRLEVCLGVRLAAAHLVTGDDGVEGPGRQARHEHVRELGPRHRDQRARYASLADRAEELDRPGTPGDVRPGARHDTGEQAAHHLLRLAPDRRAVEDHPGRGEQVLTDQVVRVRVRPGAAGLLHEEVLLGDPGGLGVHDRAVHVPQDGGGQEGWLGVLARHPSTLEQSV
ncbi:hypothetical protein SGUI_0325 [Serinicoccus hydrothermalis]|uniref:Uncharacterized protein n=1 Tax=Serinicoccus hydrothermalis TaxID=1758689 RepID=A0A1B1N8H5_9MICO|nr:hypothetical protein SGUI_0325 [Serinicoccus hydrothermalis]